MEAMASTANVTSLVGHPSGEGMRSYKESSGHSYSFSDVAYLAKYLLDSAR